MAIFYVAAHAFIERNGNEFLVTRRSIRNDYMPLKWDIPGGTVEDGETVYDTVKREVFEETGLLVQIVKPIHVYSNLSQLPKRETIQISFLCRYIDGEIVLNPEEHDQYDWVSIDEIKAKPTIAFVESLINDDIAISAI